MSGSIFWKKYNNYNNNNKKKLIKLGLRCLVLCVIACEKSLSQGRVH